MKDNNKKIFLGVIVVATLIITIVGATFAFFSASGGSANNAVTANATTLANLGFTSSHSKIASNLVPVSSESEYFSRYPGIAASGEHSCLDDVGNEICSIYEFTVTNTASVAQTIYVSFVPSENTFDNMYFAAFNTSIASASYEVATGSNGSGSNFVLTPQTTSGNLTLGHQATKLMKNSTSPIEMPGLSTSLGAGESITYTVLVWLQETKNDQNTEQGGSFKAGVNVTTGGNSTGVTGVMGGSENYVYTVSETATSIGQPIPNGIVTYTTAASAMAEFGHDFFIRHKIEESSAYYIVRKNDGQIYGNSPFYTETECNNEIDDDDTVCQHFDNVITESYVGFLKDGTIYYLKGGDDGASYSTNVGALTTAFGSSNCTDDHRGFNCGLSTIFAGHDRGNVYAQNNEYMDYWYCRVSIYRYGESRCDFDSGILS